jgi:hypothetical protein
MSIFASTDFPDRLSPMLVKELRQGLRAKTFISVFLSLQFILLIILLTATASNSSASAGKLISGFIFTFFAIAVLIVQPLRGIGALSSEVKGNTLDMIVLTRLTARRIVYGKWFAIVSQSALIFATIIPYLIFRYFFGKMNLLGEIVLLMMIFLTSMALTAITVGLSGSSSVILRALLPIIGIPILTYSALVFIFSRGFMGGPSVIEYCALGDFQSRAYVGSYALAILYLGWSLLSLGVSFIAPAAENHTTRRRLIILLVALACAAIIGGTTVKEEIVPLLFVLIALPAMATALTERTTLPPGVRTPFSRNGPLGKLAGLFLAPGWPAGVFFSLLLSGIFLGVTYSGLMPTWTVDYQVVLASLIGGLLFPAVVLTLFRVDEATRVSAYILILAATVIFTIVMWGIIESLRNEELLWFLAWNPLSFLSIVGSKPDGYQFASKAAPVITGIYFLLLIVMAMITMKRMRKSDEAVTIPET